MVRLLSPFIALAILASSVLAQEDRGLSLMERGAKLFMEGILKEMEPAIEEFEGLADQMGPALKLFADEMGPKLAEILDQVEDWSVYEAPEMLPNGDIIIRRKPDPPLAKPDAPLEPEPQIEL
ncbi:MAG: hypothetical protein WBB25_01105 [Sulfitobacter sp.]